MCLLFLLVVVVTLIKHNKQGNLKKRSFILVYGSREGYEAQQQTWWLEQEAGRLYLIHKHKPERELEVG